MLQVNNLTGFGVGAPASTGGPSFIASASFEGLSDINFEIQVPVPTHSVGDLLICAVNGQESDPVAPAGWTAIRLISAKPQVASWYRIATAGEPATYTWTITKAGKDISAAMMSFSNAAYDVNGANASTAIDVTTIDAPSITATAPGLLLAACATRLASTSSPAGFAQIENLVAPKYRLYVGYKSIPAGATGTSTFTFALSRCEAAHISII